MKAFRYLFQVIRLDFNAMDMPYNYACPYDSLSIYDGLSTDSNVPFVKLCDDPGYIMLPGNTARLEFQSDGSGTDTGFSLTYSAVDGD